MQTSRPDFADFAIAPPPLFPLVGRFVLWHTIGIQTAKGYAVSNRCSWETLWTFKTRNFIVKWQVTACDDLDLSWDETGETAANIASGLWTAFDSRVAVFYHGECIGEDHLGQSIYETVADFRDHIGMNAKGHGSYFSDMVRAAIEQARAHMAERPYIRAA